VKFHFNPTRITGTLYIYIYIYIYTFFLISRSVLIRTKNVSEKVIKKFKTHISCSVIYEGWNFNSGNYLFTTDTK